jgi:hypothetical protein
MPSTIILKTLLENTMGINEISEIWAKAELSLDELCHLELCKREIAEAINEGKKEEAIAAAHSVLELYARNKHLLNAALKRLAEYI